MLRLRLQTGIVPTTGVALRQLRSSLFMFDGRLRTPDGSKDRAVTCSPAKPRSRDLRVGPPSSYSRCVSVFTGLSQRITLADVASSTKMDAKFKLFKKGAVVVDLVRALTF